MRRPGMMALGAEERPGDAGHVLLRMWSYLRDMRRAIAGALDGGHDRGGAHGGRPVLHRGRPSTRR